MTPSINTRMTSTTHENSDIRAILHIAIYLHPLLVTKSSTQLMPFRYCNFSLQRVLFSHKSRVISKYRHIPTCKRQAWSKLSYSLHPCKRLQRLAIVDLLDVYIRKSLPNHTYLPYTKRHSTLYTVTALWNFESCGSGILIWRIVRRVWNAEFYM